MSQCSTEPCILWGISAAYFGIACFLVVLAIVARLVIALLLALITLILKGSGKHSWCEPVYEDLLTPTTWFLRFGCLFGAFSLLTPPPFNVNPIARGFYYVVAIPFCIIWSVWTFIFLRVVSNIAVDEFAWKEVQRAQQKAARRKYTQVSTETPILQFKSSSFNGKNGKGQSARATSLRQVLLIFRILILIVVMLICASILGIDFSEFLNKTAVWFFVLVLALIPHLRSIYMGIMYLFLYTDDEWTCTHLENSVSLHWADFISGEPSLARVKLRSNADGSIWVVPHNYYADQFGMSESRSKITEIPLCLSIGIRKDIAAKDLRRCFAEAREVLTTLHPALSLHNARSPRTGFVTYDPVRSRLLVMCSVFTNSDSAPDLRAEIQSALIEAVRPWFDNCNEDDDSFRFVPCVPESGYPEQAEVYCYSLLESFPLNPLQSVT